MENAKPSSKADKPSLEHEENTMTEAYIIDAARTPRGIGKAGKGALSEFHPSRLLAKVFEGSASATT